MKRTANEKYFDNQILLPHFLLFRHAIKLSYQSLTNIQKNFRLIIKLNIKTLKEQAKTQPKLSSETMI
jgi:hypothetical protein